MRAGDLSGAPLSEDQEANLGVSRPGSGNRAGSCGVFTRIMGWGWGSGEVLEVPGGAATYGAARGRDGGIKDAICARLRF